MNRKTILFSSLGFAVTLLGACAPHTVRLHGDWQAKEHAAQPYVRVLVVGVSPDLNQRCAFENFFASALRDGGTVVMTSCRALPAQAPLSRENIEKAVAANDIQAVLATILVATRTGLQEGGTEESRGDAFYKATDFGYATGWHPGSYGVYGVPVVYGRFETAPPITTIEGEVELTTRVFDTRDATLVYQLSTRARNLESRISGLAETTGPMAGELRKDGVIR